MNYAMNMVQLSQKDVRFDGDMSLVEDSPLKSPQCKRQCLIATQAKEDQCGEDNRSVACELDFNDTLAYGMDEFDGDFSNLNLDQSCQTMEDSPCDPSYWHRSTSWCHVCASSWLIRIQHTKNDSYR